MTFEHQYVYKYLHTPEQRYDRHGVVHINVLHSNGLDFKSRWSCSISRLLTILTG